MPPLVARQAQHLIGPHRGLVREVGFGEEPQIDGHVRIAREGVRMDGFKDPVCHEDGADSLREGQLVGRALVHPAPLGVAVVLEMQGLVAPALVVKHKPMHEIEQNVVQHHCEDSHHDRLPPLRRCFRQHPLALQRKVWFF